jgi:transcriptional regulator with XRE-family HTH domain
MRATILDYMTSTTDSFGQRVRRLRLRKALSQADLAERAGISRVSVIHIENDGRPAWPSTIRKLAKALGVKPEQLTTDQGE